MPTSPLAALALTFEPATSRYILPEVSTKPPSPLSDPPRAVIVPCTRAASSAQTITFPPSPSVIASAFIETFSPT